MIMKTKDGSCVVILYMIEDLATAHYLGLQIYYEK